MASIPQLRAVLRHECPDTAVNRGIVIIHHKTLGAPYCSYKLVTDVIRAVKINCFVIPVVYGLMYHGCQPFRHSGLETPSL